MRGMDRVTGAALADTAHLHQSITDILTTPLGARVMRRDYGSLLPRLIDAPFNAATRIRLYAATAAALMRWEPRIALDRVSMALGDVPGSVVIDIEATRTDTPVPAATRFTIPLSAAA